jgi:hypothetical protein
MRSGGASTVRSWSTGRASLQPGATLAYPAAPASPGLPPAWHGPAASLPRACRGPAAKSGTGLPSAWPRACRQAWRRRDHGLAPAWPRARCRAGGRSAALARHAAAWRPWRPCHPLMPGPGYVSRPESRKGFVLADRAAGRPPARAESARAGGVGPRRSWPRPGNPAASVGTAWQYRIGRGRGRTRATRGADNIQESGQRRYVPRRPAHPLQIFPCLQQGL